MELKALHRNIMGSPTHAFHMYMQERSHKPDKILRVAVQLSISEEPLLEILGASEKKRWKLQLD